MPTVKVASLMRLVKLPNLRLPFKQFEGEEIYCCFLSLSVDQPVFNILRPVHKLMID